MPQSRNSATLHAGFSVSRPAITPLVELPQTTIYSALCMAVPFGLVQAVIRRRISAFISAATMKLSS